MRRRVHAAASGGGRNDAFSGATSGIGGQDRDLEPHPSVLRQTREELAKAAALFDEVSRPAGSVLVREGVPGNEFYVLVDGTVTASVHDETLATLTSGDFFGEMSLLENAPRAATITADTDVTLLVAEPRGFAALWSTAPGVGVRMLRTMSSRLRSIEAAAHQ